MYISPFTDPCSPTHMASHLPFSPASLFNSAIFVLSSGASLSMAPISFQINQPISIFLTHCTLSDPFLASDFLWTTCALSLFLPPEPSPPSLPSDPRAFLVPLTYIPLALPPIAPHTPHPQERLCLHL